MKAIVLAGGKGTRLAPYTTILPKPLVPVDDMPILEVVLRQLARHGFYDVTLAVGYLAGLLMAYCGDGSRFGVRIEYSQEDTPLGTAGPIALVKDLRETFLVMNGDLLTTLDYSAMLEHHRRAGAIATLASHPRDLKVNLGVIETDADGWVRDYTEKPTIHYKVCTGIYLFEPQVLEYMNPGQHMDLPDLILTLLRSSQKVNTYHHLGYWLDIGSHDDYERAVQEFLVHRNEFLLE